MRIERADVADFTYLLAIARHRSFRKAAGELGISASALSHSLKGLEARLGVRLVNRTSRSVTLTSAGSGFVEAIRGPFASIGEAVEGLNRFRETPAGSIRLNVGGDAAALLLGPVLPTFSQRYPDVEVEVTTTNRMIDVVEAGFDAGIRHGGTVPEDMIAQRLSADLRWMTVASPAYLRSNGAPEEPGDLARHRCIGIRFRGSKAYRWEFEDDGREFDVAVEGSVYIDDTRTGLPIALGGGGIMYGPEPVFAPHVAAGALVPVLERYATHGPGYHAYYSSRRQVPTGLRLLIELIREMRPLGL